MARQVSRVVVLALAFLWGAGARAVIAQDYYPSKPIRFVVPFGAGGTTDVLARAIGQRLTEAWGQPVVVENRPGAGGNIGTESVAKSAADGYTMLLISVGFASNPALYSKLPFDPIKDFAPVTLVATSQNVLIVHPSVPARSARELIQLAKSRPGQLNFGSSGTGTSQHLAGELFKSMAGVQMQHVPYRGSAPALTALIGGEVSLMFNNLLTALPHVKAGRLRALAVTSARRSPAAPDIPTMAASGLPGYDVSTWYGLLVPTGTAKEIVAKLNAEVVKFLNLPELNERLGSQGAEAIPSTPDQFAAHIRQEMVKWAQVVRQSGARAD